MLATLNDFHHSSLSVMKLRFDLCFSVFLCLSSLCKNKLCVVSISCWKLDLWGKSFMNKSMHGRKGLNSIIITFTYLFRIVSARDSIPQILFNVHANNGIVSV